MEIEENLFDEQSDIEILYLLVYIYGGLLVFLLVLIVILFGIIHSMKKKINRNHQELLNRYVGW
jgi:uncharacterized iron-regulated membrane protein